MQIIVRNAFAVPHQKQCGAAKEVCWMRAVLGYGSQKRDIFDSVAIR